MSKMQDFKTLNCILKIGLVARIAEFHTLVLIGIAKCLSELKTTDKEAIYKL